MLLAAVLLQSVTLDYTIHMSASAASGATHSNDVTKSGAAGARCVNSIYHQRDDVDVPLCRVLGILCNASVIYVIAQSR